MKLDDFPILREKKQPLSWIEVFELIGLFLLILAVCVLPFLAVPLQLSQSNFSLHHAPMTGLKLSEYEPRLQEAVETRPLSELIMVELKAEPEADPPVLGFEALLVRHPISRLQEDWGSRISWLSNGSHRVKMIPQEDREEIENELRAMRILAKNPHPNLHAPKAVFYGKMASPVLSEYIEGVTWRALDRLELGETILIMREVAKGLDHLHSLNLGHGQVHVENIVIDKDGSVYLIDFGHATAKTDDNDDVYQLLKSGFCMLADVHKEGLWQQKLPSPIAPAWFKDLFSRAHQLSPRDLIQELNKHLPNPEVHHQTLAKVAQEAV